MKGEAFYQLLKAVGKKLTELRKAKGYSSHHDFALDFDLPRIQYWRLEKGKANFTIFSLARVLAIHNLSIQEFFQTLPETQVKTKKKTDVTEKSEIII